MGNNSIGLKGQIWTSDLNSVTSITLISICILPANSHFYSLWGYCSIQVASEVSIWTWWMVTSIAYVSDHKIHISTNVSKLVKIRLIVGRFLQTSRPACVQYFLISYVPCVCVLAKIWRHRGGGRRWMLHRAIKVIMPRSALTAAGSNMICGSSML